ncbi:unnamed protein product, partial [Meganyctiphanes norvegica]
FQHRSTMPPVQLTWTLLLFFLAVLGLGQSAGRHCVMHFKLHLDGVVHDWQFWSINIGHGLSGCDWTKKHCASHAQGWVDEFLEQAVPPVNHGIAAKTLCDHYNTELRPEDNAYVDVVWSASDCGQGGPIHLEQLCCKIVDGYIVPNDYCQTTMGNSNATMFAH